MVYTYSGILFSLKKKEIQTHAMTWMSLKDIVLSEIGQSQKQKRVGRKGMKQLKNNLLVKQPGGMFSFPPSLVYLWER